MPDLVCRLQYFNVLYIFHINLYFLVLAQRVFFLRILDKKNRSFYIKTKNKINRTSAEVYCFLLKQNMESSTTEESARYSLSAEIINNEHDITERSTEEGMFQNKERYSLFSISFVPIDRLCHKVYIP